MTDGLTKIIRLDERFPETGEPTIQIIDLKSLRKIKIASDASDYIKCVEPVPGKTIVLVLAMSAGEYYGPNRNGDAFAERPVPGLVEKGETLVDHYKTFESQAHVYRHHMNKDPSKALGKVLKAFYNFEMHRVELLLELDNHLAADLIDKINEGKYPAVSMGCKIKYDVCAKCGNKAPTRAEYCDHARYEMNRVYPDGTKSFVWNPSPQLFDISFVIRPADRIGFMMKKVAHAAEQLHLSAELGEKVAEVEEKKAVLKKLSDMDKIIRGQAVDHEPKNKAIQIFCSFTLPNILQNSPELDDGAINELSNHSLPTSLSTLTSMGISPTSPEIAKMMVSRAMPGHQMPPEVLNRIGASSGTALEMLSQHPEIMQAIEQSGLLGLDPNNINRELGTKLSSWVEKRSNFKNYLLRRAAPIMGEAHPDIGNWENVEVAGPSGEKYTTTAGAIDRADDVNVSRQLKTLAGAALLSGAAYKALSAHPQGRYVAPLMAAAGIAGTGAAGKLMHVPTNPTSGNRVGNKLAPHNYTLDDAPINTEMRLKHGMSPETLSVLLPIASSAGATAMLAQEYNHRAATGQLGQSQNMLNRTVEGLGDVASHHPLASFISGIAGIGLGANALSGVGKFIKGAEAVDEDGVKLAEVDLNGLCLWLGEMLFE